MRALLTVLFIYVVTPLLGLSGYGILLRKMRADEISSPQTVAAFFILFFTLGGWLLVLLTAWLWEWSGLASIGVLYLIFVAPILTAFMAWRLRRQRNVSAFHRCAFLLNVAYSCFVIVALPLWMLSPFGR